MSNQGKTYGRPTAHVAVLGYLPPYRLSCSFLFCVILFRQEHVRACRATNEHSYSAHGLNRHIATCVHADMRAEP